MIKKKLRILFAGMIFILMPFFTTAQWAVIDVSAIAAAIENGFTLYSMLSNAYQSYQKSVETYNHMVEMAQGLDFSDPGLLAEKVYESFEQTMLKKLENLESIYTTKNMNVNGIRFSIEDLYTTDVYARMLDSFGNLSASDIERMTTEEEMQYFIKCGISPKNGIIIKGLGQEIDKCLRESEATLKETASIPSLMRDFAKTAGDNLEITSEVALAQKSNEIANNHLRVAIESYGLMRDQLKLSNANYAIERQKEASEQMAREYVESLNDVNFEAGINEDSAYIGVTRKK